MSKFLFALGLSCIAISAFAEHPQGGTWRFLSPGTTHIGESPLKPGNGWLALRKGKNGWELVETAVKARKVPGNTDYDIEIKNTHKDAIALFRLPQLSPGPVATPKLPKGILDTNFHKTDGRYPSFSVQFNSAEYQFKGARRKVRFSYQGRESTSAYDAVVVQSGSRSSNIGDSGGDSSETDSDNNSIRVLWIGDLDMDGKLDLITSATGTNTTGLCLYLSSEAKGNQLFGRQVCHEGSGC